MVINNVKRHIIYPRLGRELRRRGDEASDRVSALSSAHDAPPYMANESLESREHEGFPPRDIGGRIARRGLWVRASVRFEPPLGSDPEFPGDPHNPLLVIRTIPLETQYFPYRNTTNRWATWHVSLCFKSDPHTDEDLGYLVHKFDGKELHLQFSRISNHITSGDLDTQNDPIASDPVVNRIHGAGTYWRKPLHISF